MLQGLKFFGKNLFGTLTPEEPTEERAFAPHCDQRVLHAPGTCQYCDEYPDRQKARTEMSICFTGEKSDGFKGPCPSDFHRGTAGAHIWPGNHPRRS